MSKIQKLNFETKETLIELFQKNDSILKEVEKETLENLNLSNIQKLTFKEVVEVLKESGFTFSLSQTNWVNDYSDIKTGKFYLHFKNGKYISSDFSDSLVLDIRNIGEKNSTVLDYIEDFSI